MDFIYWLWSGCRPLGSRQFPRIADFSCYLVIYSKNWLFSQSSVAAWLSTVILIFLCLGPHPSSESILRSRTCLSCPAFLLLTSNQWAFVVTGVEGLGLLCSMWWPRPSWWHSDLGNGEDLVVRARPPQGIIVHWSVWVARFNCIGPIT